MTDLISRADAIEAVADLPNAYNGWSDTYDKACIIGVIEELPSADAVQGGDAEMDNCQVQAPQNYMQQSRHNDGTDLINRADAIEVVRKCVVESELLADWNKAMESAQELLSALPSAEAKPTVIRSKTLLPTKDFKEWAKRVRETNPNVIVIPCDAEVVSADAVPQLRQTDTLIIADALRYLAKDTERHLVDRTRADALRQQFLKYGASMCKGGDTE